MSKMPVTGFAFMVGIFSLIGLPPLNGFWSEWMIFGGGLVAGKFIFTVIGLIGTVLTAGYLLWFAWRMFFGPLPKNLEKVHESSSFVLLPIVILTITAILLGLWPELLLRYIRPAAELLLGFQNLG